MKRFSHTKNAPWNRGGTGEAVRQLENLRSEFFVDLSHQLRTPITALKLAMDGLFAQIDGVLTHSQRDLASISRRNIERIVTLVENQLDLLHAVAGKRAVCRRLTDLEALLHGHARWYLDAAAPTSEARDGVRHPDIQLGDGAIEGRPLLVFTDPDLLAAVIDCVLGAASANAKRTIRVDYDGRACVYQLDISADASGPASSESADLLEGRLPALDFESRVYASMIERLGGEGSAGWDGRRRWARVRLPRYPAFDRDKDLLGPVRKLQMASVRTAPPSVLHVVRCDLGADDTPDFLATPIGADGGTGSSILSVLADGDVVMRGRQHGSVYVALAGRTEDELSRITAEWARAVGAADRVWEPKPIPAGERCLEGYFEETQLV